MEYWYKKCVCLCQRNEVNQQENFAKSIKKCVLWVLSYFPSFRFNISPPLIHNHVKALFMIHLILRDFHEIEHGKWVARKSEGTRQETFSVPSCHKLCFAMLMTTFIQPRRFAYVPSLLLRSRMQGKLFFHPNSVCKRSESNKSIFNYLLLI